MKIVNPGTLLVPHALPKVLSRQQRQNQQTGTGSTVGAILLRPGKTKIPVPRATAHKNNRFDNLAVYFLSGYRIFVINFKHSL